MNPTEEQEIRAVLAPLYEQVRRERERAEKAEAALGKEALAAYGQQELATALDRAEKAEAALREIADLRGIHLTPEVVIARRALSDSGER